MKVINLKTGNIFELPDDEAKNLINDGSAEFAEYSKDGEYLKKEHEVSNTVLSMILDT